MKRRAQALLLALYRATIIHLDITVTQSDVVCTKYVRATLFHAFAFVYF